MENESNLHSSDASEQDVAVDWQPLTRVQRRVAGVLVEKSKTTPDVYPMTLNGIKTASNQKSNRSPKMELQEHEVEDVLYELRELGAVVEVHSGGRVPKFKHQLYEWLGVEKAELAVMAELLLRGEQSLGDLRARAARMEKTIAGLNELRPLMSSLLEKNLVVELTPPGRGQIVTHNLYLPEELERLKSNMGSHERIESSPSLSSQRSIAPSHSDSQVSHSDLESRVAELERQVAELRKVVKDIQQ